MDKKSVVVIIGLLLVLAGLIALANIFGITGHTQETTAGRSRGVEDNPDGVSSSGDSGGSIGLDNGAFAFKKNSELSFGSDSGAIKQGGLTGDGAISRTSEGDSSGQIPCDSSLSGHLTTLSASGISPSGATLNGEYEEGYFSSLYFQYGSADVEESNTVVQIPSNGQGMLPISQGVSAPLPTLFRLVGVVSDGHTTSYACGDTLVLGSSGSGAVSRNESNQTNMTCPDGSSAYSFIENVPYTIDQAIVITKPTSSNFVDVSVNSNSMGSLSTGVSFQLTNSFATVFDIFYSSNPDVSSTTALCVSKELSSNTPPIGDNVPGEAVSITGKPGTYNARVGDGNNIEGVGVFRIYDLNGESVVLPVQDNGLKTNLVETQFGKLIFINNLRIEDTLSISLFNVFKDEQYKDKYFLFSSNGKFSKNPDGWKDFIALYNPKGNSFIGLDSKDAFVGGSFTLVDKNNNVYDLLITKINPDNTADFIFGLRGTIQDNIKGCVSPDDNQFVTIGYMKDGDTCTDGGWESSGTQNSRGFWSIFNRQQEGLVN